MSKGQKEKAVTELNQAAREEHAAVACKLIGMTGDYSQTFTQEDNYVSPRELYCFYSNAPRIPPRSNWRLGGLRAKWLDLFVLQASKIPRKCSQEAPKSPPGEPKSTPRAPQEKTQDGPRWPQNDPKMAPRQPKMAPRRPKMAQRWPQDVPRRPMMASKNL